MRTLSTLAIFLMLSGLAFAAAPNPGAEKPAASPEPAPAESAAKSEETLPTEIEPETLDAAPVGVIVHFVEPKTGRPFSFYVPKAYDKAQAWPLLIECTGEGVGRRNITKVWQLADKFKLITASPDTWGVRGRPGSGATAEKKIKGWSRTGQEINVPQVVRGKDDIVADLKADTEAIGRMVTLLDKSYNINSNLVVLTGYSGGAWTAYYTGLAEPKRYAGVCIRSGGFDSSLLPPNLAAARKLPITVVIGDKDLALVLEETGKAEEFFKAQKFEDFQVERLPNSGHDNRPEVAGNFVGLLRTKVLEQVRAKMRPQYEKLLENGRAARQRGDRVKAREWFEKALQMEREAEFPPQATEELKKLNSAGAEPGPKQGG